MLYGQNALSLCLSVFGTFSFGERGEGDWGAPLGRLDTLGAADRETTSLERPRKAEHKASWAVFGGVEVKLRVLDRLS